MTDGEIRAIRKIRQLIDEYKERSEWCISVGEYNESECNLNVIDDLKDIIDAIVGKQGNKILTDDEREYLSAVVKPFRNEVDYIEKIEKDEFEHEGQILITFKREFTATYQHKTCFPWFKAGEHYAGMENGVHYRLEELGL